MNYSSVGAAAKRPGFATLFAPPELSCKKGQLCKYAIYVSLK
jgi:hypothetical protein